MNPLKRGRIRLALAALGAVGMLAIFVGVAAATTVTGTATLSAGTLAITNPSSIAFSGALSVSATYFSDVADPVQVANPGGASGWNVTAYYNGFTCQSSTGVTGCNSTTPDTLGDTLGINGTGSTSPSDNSHPPTSACYVAGCTVATTNVSYPVSSISTSSGTPTKIYNATAGTGVGGIDSQDVWWLTAPANAKPGTYTSTITLAINSGP